MRPIADIASCVGQLRREVEGQIAPVMIETIRGVDWFLGPEPVEYMKKPRLVNLKGTFAK